MITAIAAKIFSNCYDHMETTLKLLRLRDRLYRCRLLEASLNFFFTDRSDRSDSNEIEYRQ